VQKGFRFTIGIASTSLTIAIALAGAVLIPSTVSAVCGYGNCSSAPPGYCLNGLCYIAPERQSSYFDPDCSGGSVYCNWDICFFYERLNGSCSPGAQCYDSDNFSCGGTNCYAICGDDEQCVCGCQNGVWSCEGSVCSCGSSPILINLKNNSADDRLTSAGAGVTFDLDANGFAERVAWTEAHSPAGFLVLDRNQNGIIDNGSELFGTATVKRDGSLAQNGFDAMAEFDLNGDLRLDARDGVYGNLRIWLDSNHSGSSEPGELLTLAEARIVAILLDYEETKRKDRFGNSYRFEGTALVAKENNEDKQRRIFDVYLMRAS
jgi:hypothetical protein